MNLLPSRTKTVMAERQRFVHLWREGLSIRAIAKHTGSSASTVRRWVSRWRKGDDLNTKYNKARYMTPAGSYKGDDLQPICSNARCLKHQETYSADDLHTKYNKARYSKQPGTYEPYSLPSVSFSQSNNRSYDDYSSFYHNLQSLYKTHFYFHFRPGIDTFNAQLEFVPQNPVNYYSLPQVKSVSQLQHEFPSLSH